MKVGSFIKDPETLRREMLREVLKCSYCGYCEWVCPTLKVINMRLHGPRGRVNSIIMALRENVINEDFIEGVYTCLLCGACITECPAGINIPENIRRFRYYINTTGKS